VERLFGLPVDTLATALVVVMALAFGVIGVCAARNRVFLRMATRNTVRRRARSALIVGGLMLATAIIGSSLVTGDTMSRTIRSSVLQALGSTDETVVAAGAELDASLELDAFAAVAYFDQEAVETVRDAVRGSTLVDGIAPAVIEPIAVQDRTSRQSEPRVTLFGTDPASHAGFGAITAADGGDARSLADLGPAEVYLNQDAADELRTAPGATVLAFGGRAPVELHVRDVVAFRGTGTDGPAVLAPLPLAQQIVGEEGRISHVLVSNAGGEITGAAHSDEVVDLLAPALRGAGLEVVAAKQDGLDAAAEQGNTFLSLFSTFGTFAIAAGILLIFLIFVMLAAERRTEMGIARAVGTQRGHLVQSFVFEGALYDLVAAAVGALVGLVVAYVMVEVVSSAFTTEDFAIEHAVRPASLVVAYGLGVVLTLLVVAVSAWRVSVLNVVAAIRSLPSPLVRASRRARWGRGALVIVAGALVALAGASGGQATPFLLGISIVIIGLIPLARALGVGDRVAYTVAGIALVAWWLLPSGAYKALVGTLTWDFSVWVVSGLMVVLGATWTITYNADVILAALGRGAGRIRSLAPVVRMAVAYPLRSRLRTSMTLAMFTLVVYTLVTGTTISGSFITNLDNLDGFSGGFDVRAAMVPLRPIDDMHAEIARVGPSAGIDPESIEAVGAQSLVPVEARQNGTAAAPADYPVRGLDDEFLATTTYGLAAVAEGYGSDAAVWRALAERPGLAVADPFVAPRRNQFMFGTLPEFQLQGFYVEDEVFAPVDVDVRDPTTGTETTLTVIGVLDDSVPWEMAGITTSQRTLALFGDRAAPSTFWFAVSDGADPDATVAALESAFLDDGLEAQTLRDRLDEAVGSSWTVNRLIQGFIGLGLVVGVVALGVVSARAVVERRQQIGVLRAIGFQPGMVRLAFLAEASFVSLTAIALGCGLGLLTSYNVVASVGAQAHVALVVPWLNLAVIFTVVYLAALASTLLPAIRASRVYPAEALRYE
jgi:putative ABC transport system permease protein